MRVPNLDLIEISRTTSLSAWQFTWYSSVTALKRQSSVWRPTVEGALCISGQLLPWSAAHLVQDGVRGRFLRKAPSYA
jgi:hypothetical protein